MPSCGKVAGLPSYDTSKTLVPAGVTTFTRCVSKRVPTITRSLAAMHTWRRAAIHGHFSTGLSRSAAAVQVLLARGRVLAQRRLELGFECRERLEPAAALSRRGAPIGSGASRSL